MIHRRFIPVWMLVTTLSLGAAFAACGGGGSESTQGTGAGQPTGSGGATGSGGSGGGIDVSITALTLDPPSATLTVDQTTPKTQLFKAVATLAGGGTKVVPAAFTIDNPSPGSIDASGLYTTSNAAGGLVHVTASYGGKTASADLTVIFKPSVDEGSVPPGTPDLFDPGKNTPITGDPLAPDLVYPSGGTMFPPNVYKILFQWRGHDHPLFRVHFEGPFLDFSIYTDGAHAVCAAAQTDAGCWEASLPTWQWLTASAAGKSVHVTVEAADPAVPGSFYVGKGIDIRFAKKPVPGAIYYWSTTQAGVMRAAVSDAAPSSFMTPNEVGKCVACHTLSRNGKRLGADVGGETLWVAGVDTTVPPPIVFNSYNNKTIPNAWSTFNPDATRIVSARGGVMKLLDGDTGAPIGAGNGAIDLGNKFGTQPDWAPDGAHLVFTYGGSNKDRGVQGSSIAMLDHASDAFSNLTVVRQSSGASDTYGYPMFDPTSHWIAYMHATGASDKNAAAKLYVAPAQAGAPETDLVAANTVVADGVVMVGIANNMPTWAPGSAADETLWIAFASKRDYGLVLENGSKYGSGLQQLWVAAIDPAKLGSGDPSFPAFRLPFQLLNENNHRPFWAEDATIPTCDGGPCTPDGGTNDGGACKAVDEDCSTGFCCAGLTCSPNATGTSYVCEVSIN
ncbi:tolB protein precursor [Minicystis rosea]|nr:tolB protein precursor [Minicystis rosea]